MHLIFSIQMCFTLKKNQFKFFGIYNLISDSKFLFLGDLLCTRIRCRSLGLRYTNYEASDASEESHLQAIGVLEGTKSERWNDVCLECDFEPMAPVCGPNWKTYRSLCHAQFCAGYHMEDVRMGACEDLVLILYVLVCIDFLQFLTFPASLKFINLDCVHA